MEKEKPWHPLGWIAFGVVGTLIVMYLLRTTDPLDGKGPAYVSYLDQERTLCEDFARRLKAANIDGRDAYLRVEVAANGCIGYLQGVVDQGNHNPAQTNSRFEQVRNAGREFRDWAMAALRRWAIQEKQGDCHAYQAKALDPGEQLRETLKLLDEQEKERRKAVKETLGRCVFKNWGDLGR